MRQKPHGQAPMPRQTIEEVDRQAERAGLADIEEGRWCFGNRDVTAKGDVLAVHAAESLGWDTQPD
jgi:hypothetical protein